VRELLPIIPALACKEKLLRIVVDTPHEVQDEHAHQEQFKLCLMVLQGNPDEHDVLQMWTVGAKEHI
jgi:hypothetical protein